MLFDTSVLAAFFNSRDGNHLKAKKIVEEAKDMIITDYIFDEVMNLIEHKTHKAHAVRVGTKLVDEALLVNVTPDMFEKSWEIYKKNDSLSFTDSSIIVAANEIQTRVATFDQALARNKMIQVITE